MGKVKYLLVDMSILPEIYAKVVEANGYLQSGEQGDDVTAINAKLIDNAGVLSSVMNELYLAGANILAVNQSIPVNNIADVSITVRLSQTDVSTEDLILKIKNIGGVKSAEIV